MDVTIVGAGAVGLVVGGFLEQAGHRVELVVRSASGATRPRIVDARTGRTLVARTPEARAATSARTEPELAWLAVRGDQVEDAMTTLVMATVALAPIVVIAAPIAPSRLESLRRTWPATHFLTFTPLFNAWTEDGALRFVRPLGLRDLVSEEDAPGARAARRDVVRLCNAAGIAARGSRSGHRATRVPFSSGLALLAGWEIAGWSEAVLGHDPSLTLRVAGGMREAAAVEHRASRSALGWAVRAVPITVLALVLRVLPRLLDRDAAAMWRHHGPKIAGQTRAMLRGLTSRGASLGVATTHLDELHRALERS